MGVPIDITVIADPVIRAGLTNGSMKLFGSVVRDSLTGRIIVHLPDVNHLPKSNNPLVLIALAGAAAAAIGVGTYLWLQSKTKAPHPLENTLRTLEQELSKGTLELQTVQSLHQQLGAFVTQWQTRAADKTAALPKDQVETLERLLKLLTEINQQIPQEALESGEVQGSIRLLETALAPVPVAVGVA